MAAKKAPDEAPDEPKDDPAPDEPKDDPAPDVHPGTLPGSIRVVEVNDPYARRPGPRHLVVLVIGREVRADGLTYVRALPIGYVDEAMDMPADGLI